MMQTVTQTIIEALYIYFRDCPLIEKHKINVDFLPEKGIEFSIDSTPAAEIVKWYTTGASIRQYLFVMRSVRDYSSDVLQNITNSGFFEQFAEWLEVQTKLGNLPHLPYGMTAQKITAESTGYLFTAEPNMGRYQIQCRLIYKKECI